MGFISSTIPLVGAPVARAFGLTVYSGTIIETAEEGSESGLTPGPPRYVSEPSNPYRT